MPLTLHFTSNRPITGIGHLLSPNGRGGPNMSRGTLAPSELCANDTPAHLRGGRRRTRPRRSHMAVLPFPARPPSARAVSRHARTLGTHPAHTTHVEVALGAREAACSRAYRLAAACHVALQLLAFTAARAPVVDQRVAAHVARLLPADRPTRRSCRPHDCHTSLFATACRDVARVVAFALALPPCLLC